MKHVVLLKSRSGNHGGLEKYASRIAKAFLEKGARVTVLTTGDSLKGLSKNKMKYSDSARQSPIEVLRPERGGSPPRGKGDEEDRLDEVAANPNALDDSLTSLNSEIPFYSTKTVPWPAFLRMEQFDWFVQRWLKKNQADLVFGMDRNRYQTHIRAGNGVHAAYLKSRILTEGRIKALFCKFNPLHRKILSLEKTAFENPSLQKIFANSHMVRQQILQHYAVDPEKIQVIHNGVEWKEMENDFSVWEKEKAAGLKKFNLEGNRFHFLFIGNGYLRKGLDRLLIGLSHLRRRDFHLSVLGKDNQMDLYRAKTVQLGLKDHVHFFGPSQEIRLFYQLADCLIIPSFYDPFANVTVEALAMGLFVVSSKNNGGHEILTPDNGAVIEDLLSPKAMVDALETAFTHSKTRTSAQIIRESVKYLDFSNQLRTLMDSCG